MERELVAAELEVADEVEDDVEGADAVGARSAFVDTMVNGTVVVLIAPSAGSIQNW